MEITEFCDGIKKCLPTNKYKIIGEVSQPKLSHGHLYFNIKDNKSTIKCIIWKSKLDKIQIDIIEGDKILIEVKIDFYTFSGSINFIVENVLENMGIGNLQKKYNETKLVFKNKGYFDKKNKNMLPLVIKNIVIITSENGAAIKDFLFNLENNKSKIKYTIIDVPVQGYECHKIIATKLEEIYNNKIIFETNIDAIIITRGGGSFQDLFGFSEPELIEAIYKYKKYPIISAIGHMIDNPLIDLVADISCPTPSLAAQYLIDHNINFLNRMNLTKSKFYNEIKTNIIIEQKKINEIKCGIKRKLEELSYTLKEYKTNIEKELYKQKEHLNIIKTKIDFNLDQIHIFNNNTEILSPNYINIGDDLFMIWNGHKFKIKIIG